jgi:hypothetical protein
MTKGIPTALSAAVYTIAVLGLGYLSFGFWTTLIFTSGFLGGFILWVVMPKEVPFASIKLPYWLTFTLFVGHRVEENVLQFQVELTKITGVPVPDIMSAPLILLVLASVGAWLLVPVLMNRAAPFGRYLAWTFFAAMGITELAHFIFPFFTNKPYAYFPGMASVVLLAPAAWWGMWRLSRRVPPRPEHKVDLVIVHKYNPS